MIKLSKSAFSVLAAVLLAASLHPAWALAVASASYEVGSASFQPDGRESTFADADGQGASTGGVALSAQAVSPAGYTWPLRHAANVVGEFTYDAATRQGHGGIDIEAPEGDDVIAAMPGVVKYVHYYNGRTGSDDVTMNSYGILVILYHPLTASTTYYAHMKDVTVSVGDQVSRGQVVGHVGLTGTTLDYHLHFEVRTGATGAANLTGQGVRQNPRLFVGPANLYEGESESGITEGLLPMRRLYNPNSGEHFYTSNIAERDELIDASWIYEGVGWTSPASSAVPVYRLYNRFGGEHHFTISVEERDMLVRAGWNDEGIGWYSDDSERVPVYRQYNPNQFACNHNYTTSESENDYLVSIGWKFEGIGWYGA